MKTIIVMCVCAMLAGCLAEDAGLDHASDPTAVPLTKRQAAEVLIRAGCTRTEFCYHRDAQAVGHHVPGEQAYIDACVYENVRAYCHEDPSYCGAAGFPDAELCEPRDCTETTTTTLEGAIACAAAVDNDAQLCTEYQSPGCFYAILELSVPYP